MEEPNLSAKPVIPPEDHEAVAISTTRREEHLGSVPVDFIDENSPFNPYNRTGLLRYVSFRDNTLGLIGAQSTEGYAHNTDRQREVGRKIAEYFKVGKGVPVLDVGWGSNKFVAEGVYQLTKEPVYLIDNPTDGVGTQVPKGGTEASEGMFRMYSGDFMNASDSDSDLRDSRFGLIMFNGSWVAGGKQLDYQRINVSKVPARGQRARTQRGCKL